MNKNLLLKFNNYLNNKKIKSKRNKIFICLALLVAFSTVYILIEPAITMGEVLICTEEEHIHTEACYEEKLICDNSSTNLEDESCYEKILSCEKEEHTHTEDCYTTEEVKTLIEFINTIESIDELSAKMDEMYENDATADEIEAYYNSVITKANTAYQTYTAMTKDEQEDVTNIDKILEYDELGLINASTPLASTYVEKSGNKYTFNIYHQNTYSWSGSYNGHENTFGFTTKATTLGDLIDKKDYGTYFYPYYIVIAKRQSGNIYRITNIVSTLGGDKSGTEIPANSIVFMVSMEQNTSDYNALKTIKLGAKATLSLNNSLTTAKSSTTSLGTITFTADSGVNKTQNNNSSKLNPFQGVDTKELIEVNLYNYGSNINDKYNSNKYYPGFQQPGGTTVNHSLSLTDLDNFNFGDIIADEYVTKKINGTGSVGINTLSTVNIANRPVWNNMVSTIGTDGYPAVIDKANNNAALSLSYLFSQNTYAQKMNETSINRLFQTDSTTGGYYYDSRKNHAQFNDDTDEFVLYKEKITSNFIQYPFGNFLPLNDIVTETTQGSLANSSRISEIIDYARYKANNTTNTSLKQKYEQLYMTLINYDNLMAHKSGKYVSSWTAGDGTRSFFDAVSIQSTPTAKEITTALNDIYTIDYDESTNFFFGLEIKMNFMQPKNGLTGKDGNQPMKFFFTGDDDVWVYIDGVLFLDLSGIHRHVGGRIDFEKGMVYYYELDKSTGDVSETAYNTNPYNESEKGYPFEYILKQAGKSDEYIKSVLKSENGKYTTFKNYSTHTFNFYYMERGSGSGVMRMEFNMPLIKDNTISINKELTITDNSEVLGNPDFQFQVMKPNSTQTTTDDELFVLPGTEYNIYNDSGIKLNTKPLYVDENGIITLKAGQHAIINGIPENTGQYYVRELLNKDWLEQYEKVTIDGSSITLNSNNPTITVGKDNFTGVESNIKDISDGNTIFSFNNSVDPHEYGSLGIKKEVTSYQGSLVSKSFTFYVTIDDIPLPIGTTYTVINSTGKTTKTVETTGKIIISPNETALIENIIAGSKYKVVEELSINSGYIVIYNGDKELTSATGVILPKNDSAENSNNSSVEVTVNNKEYGEALEIPIIKNISNPEKNENGEEIKYTYNFKLVEVTDSSGKTEVSTTNTLETNTIATILEQKTRTATIVNNSISLYDKGENLFTLLYTQADYAIGTTTHYYKIVEISNNEDKYTDYDDTKYVIEVSVINKNADTIEDSFEVSITKIWKNGETNPIWIKTAESPVPPTTTFTFTNTLLSNLNISKTLEGNVDKEKEFEFRITLLNKDDTPLKAVYTYNKKTNGSEVSTIGNLDFRTDGTATVKIKHNETITINNLPSGTKYKIEELNTDGYTVTHSVQDEKTVGAITKTITLKTGENSVNYINISGFELPATGSSGMLILIIIGSFLFGMPIIYKGYTFYKRLKEIN